MKLSIATIAAVIATAAPAYAFAPQCNSPAAFSRSCSAVFSTMADSGVPPTESAPPSSVDDEPIPTKLPSDVGFDYVPLAGALAAGDLVMADQVCNSCLVTLYIEPKSRSMRPLSTLHRNL